MTLLRAGLCALSGGPLVEAEADGRGCLFAGVTVVVGCLDWGWNGGFGAELGVVVVLVEMMMAAV